MAQAAYHEGDTVSRLVLADRLEDTGCDNQLALDHLRAPYVDEYECKVCSRTRVPVMDGNDRVCYACGDDYQIKVAHPKGCWVIDRILEIGGVAPWNWITASSRS